MRFPTFLFVLLFGAICWADDARIAEIDKELNSLEQQIKDGAEPKLLQPFIDKLKAEKQSLVASAEKEATPPKAAAKPKAKPKKVQKKPKPAKASVQPNKRERELARLNQTQVDDRLERYRQLDTKIYKNTRRLQELNKSGKNWQSIKGNVRSLQEELIADQKELDLIAESLGPLRVLAQVPRSEASPSQASAAPSKAMPMVEKVSQEEGSPALKFSGHMQFRHENQNATDYQSAKEGLNLFRLRGDFRYQARPELLIGFSPQVTKSLGGDDYRPTGVADTTTDADEAENTQTQTSGLPNQPDLDYYEAFVQYKLCDCLSLKIGRQALAYGDHLVIGSLPWANAARSFDAVKTMWTFGSVNVDLFASQLSDSGSTTTSADDQLLYGLYTQLGSLAFSKETDIYVFQKDDQKNNSEINMLGFRSKGGFGKAFYRFETGAQSGQSKDDAYQVDIDLGHKVGAGKLALGFSQAGIDYDQLYPTAHKWLGFADLFGRRNIMSYRAMFHYSWTKTFSSHLFYHSFSRVNDEVSPYKLLGRDSDTYTNAASTTSKDLGSEVDLVLKYKFAKTSQLHVGGAFFQPGAFFKDQSGDDYDTAGRFVYVQLVSKF